MRIIIIPLLILFLLLFIGCTPECGDKPLPFHAKISDNFNKKDRNRIRNAMSHWNAALGTTVFIEGGEQDCFSIDPYYDYNTNIQGYTKSRACDIRINMGYLEKSLSIEGKNKRDRRFTSTILHELGHALGAKEHLEGDDSVMSTYNNNTFDCIDEKSIEFVCQERDCSGLNLGSTCTE